MGATFTKFEGEWLVRTTEEAAPGEQMTVSLRNGTVKAVTITELTRLVCDDGAVLVSFDDQTPRTARRPRAAKRTPATPKQVDYAARLVAAGWRDSDAGQYAAAPTRAELAEMSRREISALIDDLR